MNKNLYPSPYELQEVLSSYTKRAFVDLFARERGVFFLNAKHEEIRGIYHISYMKKVR